MKTSITIVTALLAMIVAGDFAAAQLEPHGHTVAKQLLKKSGVKGGLVVHVGCDDGFLVAGFAAAGGERFHVHGLDTDATQVAAARKFIKQRANYGKASVDTFDGERLPYIDNLVNLIVVSEGEVSKDEITRVLAPNGVAIAIDQSGHKVLLTKPRPKNIDEWTHYLYDPSNNAVASDEVAGPPKRMQWVGGPRYSRHHDKMTSMSALVTSGGRIFYIFDEAPRVSILLKPQWNLVARDAFNGAILWKRQISKWQSHLTSLKSGPAQLPRRLIAKGDRVYVTLQIDGPMQALDAATGKTLTTFAESDGTEEAVLADDVLFLLVKEKARSKPTRANRNRAWTPDGWKIMAANANTGKVMWTVKEPVLPNTMAIDHERVVFHNGESVVCLNRKDGKEFWRSEKVARAETIRSFFSPTLVLYKDVVLFSGGEAASKQTGGWYRGGKDTMTALDANDGYVLWTADHPPSGYKSAEDVLVVDGLVWTGETTSGRAEGLFSGRDLRTGKVMRSFEPNVDTYWFHHRCHRGKATGKYLLMSRTGIEFLDVKKKTWDINHFVRGACLYGIMPANGLVYAPQHPCACYLEAKLYGFNALAPASAKPQPEPVRDQARLEKGPAYSSEISNLKSQIAESEWPTFRKNNARTGSTKAVVPTALKKSWTTSIGGHLTAPIVANGRLFVASRDNHTLHAVNATSGEKLWQYTVGGRVDSPPTWFEGRLLFGSADGYVYCLRAADGALMWRFLAAQMDRRTMSFEQLESVWPVHGSVLVQNGEAVFVSGRSMFLDGGLRMWRLDAATGKIISSTVMDEKEEGTDKNLHEFVSWLNMPTGLPDVLSSDGKFVYMRSQPFDMNGKRLPLKPMPKGRDADHGAPDPVHDKVHSHVFSPTGYLDDSWWHRSYWLHGTMFVSGWQGYYRAGKSTPAGRILVSDEKNIYGFGRKPKYWRWTTPIEHQLFSAPKSQTGETVKAPAPKQTGGATLVQINNSKTLNPANSALTIEAWVKVLKPDGAIIARGGDLNGFSLYVSKERPVFAVRSNRKLATVTSKAPITGQWVHLAGVLTDKAELQLYVDGKLAARRKGAGLLTGNPLDSMQLGEDNDTNAGDYGDPFGFTGLIDEVRVYQQALTADQVAANAASDGKTFVKKGLVLAYNFDGGKAVDTSGNKNNGRVSGAKSVVGKVGRALRFDGSAMPTSRRQPGVSGFSVKYNWTIDLPLYARAMVLAKDTIFIAGPEDLIDEESASRKVSDPATQAQLAKQMDAWSGKRGAFLWAVSSTSGEKKTDMRLDTPPVFDGMAAANGRLYVSGMDGSVTCLGPR